MLEFEFTLGPLRLAFALTNPHQAGSEYVELTTDTVLAEEDEYEPAEEDRIGFRRNR